MVFGSRPAFCAISRSVEGDALADALADLVPGVELVEQPSFTEVKAHHRLRMDYEELSEATGLDVHAGLIQVLMSTYYGRMVNTDDALLLIHDPQEALDAM